MLSFHCHLVLYFLNFLQLPPLWPMDYLVVYFISKCFEIFLSSFYYWFLVWFHYYQKIYSTWYDFNFFIVVEVFLMTQNTFYLGYCFMGTWKEHVRCCCWVFYECYLILLVHDVVHFYVLAYFQVSSLSIKDYEAHKFPTTTIGFSISAHSCINFF